MIASNDNETYEGLVRFIRAARGLEAGGFYNASKLFWALAYSHEVRASNQLDIPTNPEILDGVIETAIQDLVSQGTNPALIAALQQGR